MKHHKIALVCDWYLPRIGGIEWHLRDLAMALKEHGHEVHVICSTPGPHEEQFQVHRLNVPPRPLLNISSISAIHREFVRLFDAQRYDVVHAHSVYSVLSCIGLYVARRLGVPSIYTEHSILRGLGSVLLKALDLGLGWTAWPTIMSGVSSHVAADLREVSGRASVPVLLNAIRPAEWVVEPPQQELRVTSIMRLAARKRPLALVRMIPQVHAKLPAALRPKFTIVGDGPERSQLESEALRLGISDSLELLGWRPRSELKHILARSALLAIPSEKEALCIAAIEARAASLPVVARADNGVSDIVEHGTHGLLAESDEAFADAIVRLITDSGLRRRMSQCTSQGMERFTWPQSIKRHQEIYAMAIRLSNRGTALK